MGFLTDGPILCPFRRLTGLPCPGCGLTRSIVALVQGDLDAAFAHHRFGPFLALALLALAVGWWARRSGRHIPSPMVLAARGGAAVVALTWMAWVPSRW